MPRLYGGLGSVFPAQAGVFPPRPTARPRSSCLPRASGGVSIFGFLVFYIAKSSPRKRGCFYVRDCMEANNVVFPAQAGVFLPAHLDGLDGAESSPRKRGCFLGGSVSTATGKVFPAQAGVFLMTDFSLGQSLLSSPRKRGCFRRAGRCADLQEVFPAQAGAFLGDFCPISWLSHLIRGIVIIYQLRYSVRRWLVFPGQ